jgi:hypothetical protein
MSNTPQYIVADYAEHLGIAPDHVRRFIREGSLPAQLFIERWRHEALDVIEGLKRRSRDAGVYDKYKPSLQAMTRLIKELPDG